jgi:hypothetical protein
MESFILIKLILPLFSLIHCHIIKNIYIAVHKIPTETGLRNIMAQLPRGGWNSCMSLLETSDSITWFFS